MKKVILFLALVALVANVRVASAGVIPSFSDAMSAFKSVTDLHFPNGVQNYTKELINSTDMQKAVQDLPEPDIPTKDDAIDALKTIRDIHLPGFGKKQ